MSDRYDRRTEEQLKKALIDLESRLEQLIARSKIFKDALSVEPKDFFESVDGFYNCVEALCEINAGNPIASSKDAVELATQILCKCETAVGTTNEAAVLAAKLLNSAWIDACKGGNTTTVLIATATPEVTYMIAKSTHSAVNGMYIVFRKLLDALETLTGAENANFNDMFALAAVEADEAITNAQLEFYTTLIAMINQFEDSIANCQKDIRANRIEQA